MVRRLSEQLAAHGGDADVSSRKAPAATGSSNHISLPWWLKDSRYLNPLLTAYDERIVQLEGELGTKVQQLQDLKRQVRRTQQRWLLMQP